MKNILILADGSIAKHFIEWVGRKRVADNKYSVVTYTANTIAENMAGNITHIEADPTSFSKLSAIMEEVKYSHIFIVMENMDDARYSLKNIRLVDDKIRVILTDQWDDDEMGRDDENVTILHSDEILSAHLYDHLPNIPVVAQNVGLGKGEIMEILVPFGSTYAFRHVGSILQRKWKIAAIYRNEKQLIPNNATMIRPNDTLLVLGKPIVLDGVYKTINKRIGLFPEPFGQDLYLIIDFRHDQENVLFYLKESIYLLDKLEDKSLFIRIIYPNNFALIDEIKTYERDNITISVCYDEKDIKSLVEYDIQEHDIGLVINSLRTFEKEDLRALLYSLKKVVYLFGDQLLYNIKKCIVLMDDKEKMESISSTAFDVSESLSLELMLADFDPEGEFESRKMTIDHYETISHIFNMDIEIEQKVANPVRELTVMEDILQIAPFEKEFSTNNVMRFVSRKVQDFLLTTKRHPKLLVPFALGDA